MHVSYLSISFCDVVVALQAPKVTGFRTMTQADVPLAFRLVCEVCMVDGVKSVFGIFVFYN